MTLTPEIVFIAGIGYSGSTVLSLMLGQHPRVVGLGEVHGVVETGAGHGCSCGASRSDCAFWSRVLPRLEDMRGRPFGDRRTAVHEAFAHYFGDGVMLVDSSKELPALRALAGTPGARLKVIHLIRDVRSWIVSARDRDWTTAHAQRRGARALFRRNCLARFLQWYLVNRRIEAYLTEAGIPSLQIGYEELVLYPHEIVPRICAFLGLDEVPAMYALDGSASHVIRGNHLRFSREKLAGLVYDNRWLYSRRDWMLASLLLPPVMKFNARAVYGNFRYTRAGFERAPQPRGQIVA